MIKKLSISSILFVALCNTSCTAVPATPIETGEEKVVNNPIIQNMGVCDPHIHIFGDKAYLFASHDRLPGQDFYGMYDWWVWSSSDLVHWELEYNLFPKDMWCGATNNCWATDGAERNGKYYFYVSGNWKVGVAVSENGPEGPYIDALGDSFGYRYDPTVFIDDDKNRTPYMISGGFPYRISRMNEDMISLAEDPVDVIHEKSDSWKGDGGFLHKHNGIYYLNGHGTNYCTSSNIYGPYTYRGTFYIHWIDHPTIFSWHNQTYCAFGTKDVDNHFRKTHITYVHYKDNGEIVACGETGESFIGVGQYDCSKPVQAEWYFAASDGIRKVEKGDGFAVSEMTRGEWLYYQRVLNMAADAEITLFAKIEGKGGVLEIRQDNAHGKLLGTVSIPANRDYTSLSTKLNNKEGVNNIYIGYKGKGTLSIDWLTISSTGAIVEPAKGEPIILQQEPDADQAASDAFSRNEAEDMIYYYLLRTSDADDSDDASKKCLSYLKNGSFSSYYLDFGNTKGDSLSFAARISSKEQPGQIEIRLGAENGELLGVCDFRSTGGWQKWADAKCEVISPGGKQNVFLIFKGVDGEVIANFNWFKFSSSL